MQKDNARSRNTALSITSIDSAQARRRLFALPRRLHAADPRWISPLDFERARQWSPRHPWFEHARARAWLAYRGDRVVGSISAQIDALHQRFHGADTGFFGSLEFEDDPEVLQALLNTAGAWLRESGVQRMLGPFDLGINQSCGLLVEGFDSPPMVMMGHHPPYYARSLEQAGCRKAMDLLAYIVPPDFEAPASMRRMLDSARRRLVVRPLNRRAFDQDLALLRDIFNDAWAGNWGFVPFTQREFSHMGADLKKLLRPEYIQIAEVDGVPAAFIVALPNINELCRDLHGRLLPLGWARLLWRLYRRSATTARVPLMGVRREFQRGRLGSALAFAVIDAVRWPLHEDGVRQVELSWILETNQGMCRIIEALGSRCYKRYRLYERAL